MRKSAERWHRVLRYEDAKKIWHTHNELSTKLEEMKRVGNDDEGVLQTMVRNVVQRRSRRRSVVAFKDHYNKFSCIAAAEKIGLLQGNPDNKSKKKR